MMALSNFTWVFSKQSTKLFQGLMALILVVSMIGGQPSQPAHAEVVNDLQSESNTAFFAVITDMGTCSTDQAAVAAMVDNWKPEFIVTAGDNWQGNVMGGEGSCNSYEHVITNYYGSASSGADYVSTGNFWPTPGNHDYSAPITHYTQYFTYLPPTTSFTGATALYYDFIRGPVHFFMMDSQGALNSSQNMTAQKAWLQSALGASTAAWKIVIFHHPAYTGGAHSPSQQMRWDFAAWGADFVIAGHNHIYERILENGIRYFTAGVAGGTTRTGNQIGEAYYSGQGAMRVNASTTSITIEYVSLDGTTRDTFTQTRLAPDPIITTSVSSLPAFWSQPGAPSTSQSYTISGANLNGEIVVTPPSGFEISKTSGSGFTTEPIKLNPTGNTLSATNIFVRLKSSSLGSFNGNITHSSTDAATKNVAVRGTVSDETCIVESYIASADTYMSSYNATYNYGAQTYMRVTQSPNYPRGSLIRWDLSSIPAEAIVSEVSLTLNVSTPASATYNLYNMRRAWVEGSGAGSQTGNGATWVTYNGTNSWGTNGAANTSNDRYNTNLWGAGSSTFSTSGSKTVDLNTAGLAAIQGWVDGSIGNYGLTIQNYGGSATDYDVQFSTKDNPTPANRPRLNIIYCMASVNTYTLTVSNDGNGTVTLSPAGGNYGEGTTVTLTPEPDSDYKFSAWTGNNAGDLMDNGNGSWSITMEADKSVTANFSLKNVPPTNITLSNSSVSENRPVGTEVGVFTTTDPNAGDTHTYSLVTGEGSTDNASFSISGNSLRTSAVFDYETKSSYSIRVRSTDQDGLLFEKVFIITILDVNEAPTNISLSTNIVEENRPVGTEVGVFATTDPDSGDTHTYSLVAGIGSVDNASFGISGNKLRTSAIFDYETKSSYSIRVRSTDQGGLSFEKVFNITVLDVNEAPTDISLSTNIVEENRPVGTEVGVFTTTDPDAGDTHTYSLVTGDGSMDNGSFSISDNQLLTAEMLEYETKSTYSIRVRSTDQGGLYFEKVFTITILEVNTAPLAITQTVNTTKNQPVRIELGGPNPGGDQLVIWQIVEDPQHGLLDCVQNICLYTPESSYTGIDTFTYRVRYEGSPWSEPAVVTIHILEPEPVYILYLPLFVKNDQSTIQSSALPHNCCIVDTRNINPNRLADRIIGYRKE
jgi:hypothetical protein